MAARKCKAVCVVSIIFLLASVDLEGRERGVWRAHPAPKGLGPVVGIGRVTTSSRKRSYGSSFLDGQPLPSNGSTRRGRMGDINVGGQHRLSHRNM